MQINKSSGEKRSVPRHAWMGFSTEQKDPTSEHTHVFWGDMGDGWGLNVGLLAW